MKLISLKVVGPENYESWTGMRGSADFRDDNGNALKIVLKPGQISRILKAIANELPEQAHETIKGVANAVSDAIDGGLLLEQDGHVTLSPDFN